MNFSLNLSQNGNFWLKTAHLSLFLKILSQNTAFYPTLNTHLDLQPSLPNHATFFIKLLPMTISINWPTCIPDDLAFKRCNQKCTTTHQLIFFRMSQLSKLLDWLKLWKYEYLKEWNIKQQNKKVISCVVKTRFQEVTIFSKGNL